jgi:hypothetical protein
VIVIIPAAQQPDANAWMQANVDHEGGGETFTVGLCPAGGGAVTAYWCASDFGALEAAVRAHFPGACYDGSPEDALAAAGLAVPDPGQ